MFNSNGMKSAILAVLVALAAGCNAFENPNTDVTSDAGGQQDLNNQDTATTQDAGSTDSGQDAGTDIATMDMGNNAQDIGQDIAPPPKCGEYDCDDKNPCTTDVCDMAKGCTHTDNTAVCNDSNPSTSNDVCFLGVCCGQLAAAPVVECESGKLLDLICEDFDACTIDACLSGKCVHKAVTCDDGVECTADSCDKQLGCINKTDDTKCGVGTKCWKSGYQVKGGCFQCDPDYDTFNAPLCNDNNDCTADKCTSGKCVSTLDTEMEGGYCNDGNACTAYQDSKCKDGKCAATVNNPCDDGSSCTADSCDPKGGCSHSSLNGVCDDGVACTSGDYCQGGECYSGNAAGCDDGNPCTTDYCSFSSGKCQHASWSGAACNDGNPCTVGDKCSNGACAVGTSVNCDDNNPCTTDYCQLGMCGHTAIANCGGTVPPLPMMKVTIGCDAGACEPHVFFGAGQDLYKTTSAANGTVDLFGTKAEFCMWGGEVATRVAKSLNPFMPWYGCEAGAPASKGAMYIAIDGVPVPKPYTYISKPSICGGTGEGNIELPKALFGCQ